MATNPRTTAPLSGDRSPVAPLWHTVVLIVILLALALLQANSRARLEATGLGSRLPLYGFSILFELFLLAYVWFLGLRLAGKHLRRPNRRKVDPRHRRASRRRRRADLLGYRSSRPRGAAAILGDNFMESQAAKALLPQGIVETISGSCYR